VIVPVRHPGPVWHVPAGARRPRLGFLSLSSQARLREVGTGEALEVGRLPDGTRLRVFATRLWREVAAEDGFPLRVGDLADRLADPTASFPAAFAKIVEGSPLLGRARVGPSARGTTAAPRARHVIYDGAPGAAARLQASLDDRILISGGHVLVRCRPVLTLARPQRGGPLHLVPRLDPGGWRACPEAGSPAEAPLREIIGYAFPPDAARELLDLALSHGHVLAPSLSAEARRIAEFRSPYAHGLPPGWGAGDDDLACMADALPEAAHAEAERALAAHAGRPVGTDESACRVAALATELLPDAVDGAVGGIGHDRASVTLERCLALSRAIQEMMGPLWSPTRLPLLERYLDGYALPRLTGPGAEDDLEAMASLVP